VWPVPTFSYSFLTAIGRALLGDLMKTFLNVLGIIGALVALVLFMSWMVSCTCESAGTSTVVVGGQTHRCH